MKKLILTLIAALGIVTGAHAVEGGIAWDKAPNRTNDLASLQNGAKLFVNYCLGCHSAAFMRFNRLQDIGISEQQIKDNLLFTTEKVGDVMKANIDPRQAKEWFGANPPDLTLVARSRAGHGGTGADYLYTYLRTYYRDDTKATGWNNLAFPSVGMPHALWELQGDRRPVYTKVEQHGHEVDVFKGWEQTRPGTMTPLQYDQAVGDLVNYLQWMAEPAQNTRVRVGVWVLLFLVMALVFVWRLNTSYWKDVK
ncbi:cytochrome c1 [Variovorax arabinosiphilus]|uniref:cytochrome c1 n=1 Tax=Variovorax arabinosiphilus TaxID=3053498 RepID=UPI002574E3F4|nr:MULTISPECIES: cytochrome c1 [unclassified Variovorax]MDM0120535.1 cytochrome c1 [Variovorax sp. J2L1-78]MDM0127553.1 cytochrome c1 [Variovorax sp. J2L1-63]MDM0231252.1 cytochrome c1 [Variovorax sp. J2R1-6]